MEREMIFLVERATDGRYTARAIVYCESAGAGSSYRPDGMTQEALHCRLENQEVPPLIRLHMLEDEFIAS